MNTESSTPPRQRAVCLLTACRVISAAPVNPSEMTTTSIEAIVMSRLRRRFVAVSLTTYPPEIAIRRTSGSGHGWPPRSADESSGQHSVDAAGLVAHDGAAI